MKKLIFWCCALLMALLLSACGGDGSGAPSQPGEGAPSFVSLQVTPAQGRIPVGLEQQFIAQAIMSDGSVIDVTTDPRLSWNSSSIKIATVDAKGLAHGLAVGTITITVSGAKADGSPVSASATLDVTDSTVTALQVTPATSTVPVGLEQQFIATVILSDGSTLDVTSNSALNWSSSDAAIATVNNNDRKGLATGVSFGEATITASGGANGISFSASAVLTVNEATVTSLQVTPTTSTVPVGLGQQFIATAILSDGSTLDVTSNSALNWSSSAASIATVNNVDRKGLATGVSFGEATITASGGANGISFSASGTLTVSSAVVTSLRVTPENSTVPVGLDQHFTAVALLSDGSSLVVTDHAAVSWTSSDTTIATIDGTDNQGLAVGVAPGAVTITATGTVNGISKSATAQLTISSAAVTSLQVTPEAASVAIGLEQQFLAMAQLSDGTELDVTKSIALSWTSSDPTIATIASVLPIRKGQASGVNTGRVTITASGRASGSPFSATAELTVTDAIATGLYITPETATVGTGQTQQYAAMATFSDGSVRNVTNESVLSWTSSNTAIATITSSQSSGNGIATGGLQPGTVTIMASGISGSGTSFSMTAQLTVNTVGTVVTWGSAGFGGNSSTVAFDLTNVKSLTGSVSAFAAVKQDGTVVAWGSSSGGGDSSTVQSQLKDIQQVYSSAYGVAFAALKQDGSVVTWGEQTKGGDSSAVQEQLIDVQSVVNTENAFAALKQDGSVVAWGVASKGGDSSAVQSQLNNVQSITPVLGSGGSAFAALRSDGLVVTWGDPRFGGDSSAVQNKLTDVQSIVSNRGGAFAALKQDGTVVTWGTDANGGNSSAVQSQLTNIRSISVSDASFAATKQDGHVVTWGKSSGGGDSTLVQSQLTNVQSIVGSYNNFLALKQDGSVVQWGCPTCVPNMPSLDNVAQMYSTTNAFAVLMSDGTATAWGDPSQGGDASAVQDQLSDVKSIINNSYAFAAIKQDGSVVAWGPTNSGGDSSAVQARLVNVQLIARSTQAFAALIGP